MASDLYHRLSTKSDAVIAVVEDLPHEQSKPSSLSQVTNPTLVHEIWAGQNSDGDESDSGSSASSVPSPSSTPGGGVNQQQPLTQGHEEEEVTPVQAAIGELPLRSTIREAAKRWVQKEQEAAPAGVESYSPSSEAAPALVALKIPILLEDVDKTSGALQVDSPLIANIFPAKKTTRLGEITVTSDLTQIFPDLKEGDNVSVQTINPERIQALSRLERARLMKDSDLVNKKQWLSFEIQGKRLSKRRVFHKNGSFVSMSALIALSVAARGWPLLFVELVGCAPPVVMEELRRFCRPPLMGVSDIPKLVHVVASCTEGYQTELGQSIRRMEVATECVAYVLKKVKKDKKDKKDKTLDYGAEFEKQFREALDRPTVVPELATQMALTAVGVQKYVKRGLKSVDEKSWAYTFLQSCIGLLAFNPFTGMFAGASLPLIDKLALGFKAKKAKRYLKTLEDFNRAYNLMVDEPIFRNQQAYKAISTDRKTVRRAIVDPDTYGKPFKKILQWAGNRLT